MSRLVRTSDAGSVSIKMLLVAEVEGRSMGQFIGQQLTGGKRWVQVMLYLLLYKALML